MKRFFVMPLAVCALFFGAAFAQQTTTTNTNTNTNKTTNTNVDAKVTVIHGRVTADGSTKITDKQIDECVTSLPSLSELAPRTVGSNEFLKHINGDASRSERMQVYKASVTVNYKVRKKIHQTITTSTIDPKDPTMREEDREEMRSRTFESDPGTGDVYAGRSRRQYYYSTAEAAGDNAKMQAEAWIKQQQSIMCK